MTAEEMYELLGVPHDYRAILRSGDHFQLEKWGLIGDADKINEWINSTGPKSACIRRGFLRYHITKTIDAGFIWNNIDDYDC